MADPTRPFLVVYVLWHPTYDVGASIAEGLRQRFRRELYENVAGGTGLSVIFRSAPPPDSDVPLPIDLEHGVDRIRDLMPNGLIRKVSCARSEPLP